MYAVPPYHNAYVGYLFSSSLTITFHILYVSMTLISLTHPFRTSEQSLGNARKT